MNVKFTLLSFDVQSSATDKPETIKPAAEPASKVIKSDLAKHTPGFLLKLLKWIIP